MYIFVFSQFNLFQPTLIYLINQFAHYPAHDLVLLQMLFPVLLVVNDLESKLHDSKKAKKKPKKVKKK